MRKCAVCLPTLSAIWIVIEGCAPPPPPSLCTQLCDKLYYAEEDYAIKTCDGLKTVKKDAVKACRSSCVNSWDSTTTADKKETHTCLRCVIRNIPKAPDWSKVDAAIQETCRVECIEKVDISYAWGDFYLDWYDALEYGDETCPPKFPPEDSVPDGGDGSETDSIDTLDSAASTDTDL